MHPFRRLTGACGAGEPETVCIATTSYDIAGGNFVVTLTNKAAAMDSSCTFIVTDNAYNTGGPYQLSVKAGEQVDQAVPVTTSGNWYDVSVEYVASSSSADNPAYTRR